MRFHDELRDLRERTWVARAGGIGYFVLDREAVAFFMRTPKATFPGRVLLEVQGVKSGPLYDRLKGNLLDLRGDDHRRLRKLVQPSFTPAAADRRRDAARGHLQALWEAVADARRAASSSSAFAQPYPGADDRRADGRARRRRVAARRLGEPHPAAVRPGQGGERTARARGTPRPPRSTTRAS